MLGLRELLDGGFDLIATDQFPCQKQVGFDEVWLGLADIFQQGDAIGILFGF